MLKNWMKRMAVSLAAVAVLGAAPQVLASTVTYTTIGDFWGSTHTAASTVTGASLSINPSPVSGALNLQLFFVNDIASTMSDPLPAADQYLGKFFVKYTKPSGSSSESFSGTDQFTLTITQSAPGGATNGSTAKVSGTLSYTAGGTPANTSASVLIHFTNPNPVVLTTLGFGTYSYLLQDTAIKFDTKIAGPVGDSFTSQDSFLLGNISAVPLPATASMGLAMFGALGTVVGGSALRRRSTVGV